MQGEIGQFFLTYGSPRRLWLTPLSYAFLHGDWTHLIFNGVWLAAFGSPVARRFGTALFLLLGALGAIGGAFFYLGFHLTELAPMVGASAAISAYHGRGGALRVPARRLSARDEDYAGAPPEAPKLADLNGIMANRQTLAFIGFWFASNLLIGLGGQGLGMPMRRSPGRRISAAFSWHFAGAIVRPKTQGLTQRGSLALPPERAHPHRWSICRFAELEECSIVLFKCVFSSEKSGLFGICSNDGQERSR